MLTPSQETLYAMALTRVGHLSSATLLQLYRLLGSATAIVDHRNHIEDVVPGASPKLRECLSDIDAALRRAEEELAYDQRYAIQAITFADDDYPQRLRECDDAPLVLYYRGSVSLNAHRVICIVGTRKCTAYGQDLVRKLIEDLRECCPDMLIVSGLAYGVDIQAHRQALHNGFATVGVLAHGLDELYPPRHRETAVKMLSQGGLLTEHMTGTNADKVNFVRRNRIVAGMSDACVLVESAEHGGGLITARLSREYHRDVFAFPGRIGDIYSEGCNNLIRDNGAQLITSADDLICAMGWENDRQLHTAQQAGIERQLFPELTAHEQLVVQSLQQQNDQQINLLSVSTHLPVQRLTALLFELEMKGVVRTLAGGIYHLIL